ncbi:MAG: GNAT family N-acetyltransferase [Thaumarchaeota archaeon]|nr:GNAT family N-acetyltransferase [Nitrososphaerota archaeon]MDE1867611.1 GNAT family N-acetyltransferase [Nitrososphaerota archaeon]
MKNVEVRKAVAKDIPTILELLYTLDRPRPKTGAEKIKFQKLVSGYTSDKDCAILVAELNSDIAGVVTISFMTRLNHTEPEMYIPELIVKEKYRKLGIGRSLINACVEIARKKKCYRIRLDSAHHRKEAHLFYKSLGFDQSALTFTKNTL